MAHEPNSLQTEIRAFLVSLESQPSYSKSTRQAYASDLYHFTEHLQEKLKRPPRTKDLTSLNIAAYLEDEQRAGLRTSTLLRRKSSLRTFLKYLKHEGFTEIPLNGSQIPQEAVQVHAEPLYTLSPAQIDAVWSALRKSQRTLARRDEAILILLLETGLSVSTLVALNLPDLDLRAHRLHVLFDGRENYWLPLNEAARPLEIYLAESRPELNPIPDEPALFISQFGSRMTRQTIWQVIRNWGKAADLPFRLSPRILRHTAALRLVQAGRPVAEIQIRLGHSNLLSTQALLQRLESLSPADGRSSENLNAEENNA